MDYKRYMWRKRAVSRWQWLCSVCVVPCNEHTSVFEQPASTKIRRTVASPFILENISLVRASGQRSSGVAGTASHCLRPCTRMQAARIKCHASACLGIKSAVTVLRD